MFGANFEASKDPSIKLYMYEVEVFKILFISSKR
jgi:hypothetical protein